MITFVNTCASENLRCIAVIGQHLLFSFLGLSEQHEEEFYVVSSGNTLKGLGAKCQISLPVHLHLRLLLLTAVLQLHPLVVQKDIGENVELHSDNSGLIVHEPDPDDLELKESMQVDNPNEADPNFEPDPDDREVVQYALNLGTDEKFVGSNSYEESDPDDSVQLRKTAEEPDPDASGACLEHRSRSELDDPLGNGIMQFEPDPDDNVENSMGSSRMQVDEPSPDDQELQRIQDPVSVVCARLQKSIQMLRSEVNSTEATSVLQTLFKIIKNVIENTQMR
ncbi:uncharacterized protein LOC122653087 [Telopea speciosissima]|uniref:uncharacterized protein LOC122653087 n=1 Tax=Telopea speciosissima TaxID=54955 RepID=UPI001CC63605|nr:uncharacterized protein LOC122653087 [Telopea speciosissima]